MITKEKSIQILKDNISIKPDIYIALEKLRVRRGIEIGVREAVNLSHLAQNPYFKEGVLHGADSWLEDPSRPHLNDTGFSQELLNHQCLNAIIKFNSSPHVNIIRGLSATVAPLFKDSFFDFIFIDAAHDYESVSQDLALWWPKLREGGVFSGHDYFPDKRIWRGEECGVFKAVNEFLLLHNLELSHTTDASQEGGPGVACPSFFIVK